MTKTVRSVLPELLELGEHTGTHFDAPCHWITGKDHAGNTTDTIPPQNFVAPVNVIDRSKEATENPGLTS